MTIEQYGGIMDSILIKNHVQMLINMPEGTDDPEIKDNIGLGPAVQLYILLKALRNALAEIDKMGGEDEFDKEKFVDGALELVRNDLLQTDEEEQRDEGTEIGT